MGPRISEAKAKPLPAGVWTPVITIYDDTPEQGVNLEAMYKHCQYLVDAGMHGLVYLGTNGELALLSHQERKDIIRNARKAVVDLGLPDYPIVAGISAQSTVETITCARDAAEAGAGWGLLLPPSYWAKSLSTDALLAYYRDVADQSPIPIVAYNVSENAPGWSCFIGTFADLCPAPPGWRPVSRRHIRRGPRLGPVGGAGVASQHRGHQVNVRQRGQAHTTHFQVRAGTLWRLWGQLRLSAAHAARRRQRMRDWARQRVPPVDGQDLRPLGGGQAGGGAGAAGRGGQLGVGVQEGAVADQVRRVVVRGPAAGPRQREHVRHAQAVPGAHGRPEEMERRHHGRPGRDREGSPRPPGRLTRGAPRRRRRANSKCLLVS